MAKPMFCGVGCALVTPFRNGKIDTDAFEKLIDYQMEHETDALIVCGTTGEASTLTDGEMCDLIACAASRAAGRVPVIAGCGSNSTQTALRRAKRACEAGADALLAVTPYYNKCSRAGLMEHFTSIADQSPVPVILYNVPSRTGVNLSPEAALTLFRHPMIQGMKEASQDMTQVISLLRDAGDGAYIYAGNDGMFLPMLALGARGAISVCANIAPALTRRIAVSAFRGDYEDAREAHNRLLPLIDALFASVNPIPVKAALSLMGVIQNELRLPLTPLPKEEMKALETLLIRMQLLA